MTLLQPHLGDSRCQELRNSPFWPTPLFKSQLVKDGEDFLLKKGTPKDSQGFGRYQNKQSFSSGRGKSNNRGFRGRFRPHLRGWGHGNPSPQCLLKSLPQSTSRRSPPFFQKRLASKQMFRRVKHYHQWLCYSIHLKTKFSQSSPDSIRLQGPSKRPSSGLLYPVSSVKERNRKGGKCKISRVLQSPVSGPQASPEVEASNRPKQAQHLPTCEKVQNGNTRVHQGLSDSRRMGVVDRLMTPTFTSPSTQSQGST